MNQTLFKNIYSFKKFDLKTTR